MTKKHFTNANGLPKVITIVNIIYIKYQNQTYQVNNLHIVHKTGLITSVLYIGEFLSSACPQ